MYIFDLHTLAGALIETLVDVIYLLGIDMG